jgi:hypothetical protein
MFHITDDYIGYRITFRAYVQPYYKGYIEHSFLGDLISEPQTIDYGLQPEFVFSDYGTGYRLCQTLTQR